MKKNADADDKSSKIAFPIESSLPTGAAKKAVEELGRRIANEEYPQREAIPMEAQLAESLGVSRATVRDAVKVLTGKGMLRTARRYGTRVRPIEDWNLLDADVISWHEPTHERLGQMFVETTELRCIIEPAAAALAASRATAEQIEIIVNAANDLHPNQGELLDTFAADRLFHTTILDATGNLMMRQLRPIITSILKISYDFGVQVANGSDVSRERHVLVAEAIRDRDSEAARKEMETMLDLNRARAAEYWHDRADTSSELA